MNNPKSLKILQIWKLNTFYTYFSEEISMLSVIYSGIFSSLATYLHSSKTLEGNIFYLF